MNNYRIMKLHLISAVRCIANTQPHCVQQKIYSKKYYTLI